MTEDKFTTPSGKLVPKARTGQSGVRTKARDGTDVHSDILGVHDLPAVKHDPVNKPRE